MKWFRILLLLISVTALTATVTNAWPMYSQWRDGMDGHDRPLFTDFISFWSAGKLAAQGKAEDAYDLDKLTRTAQTALPQFTAKMPYHYPPFVSLALEPFAKLPYVTAAALFQLLTLLALIIAIHRQLDPINFIFLLGAPALALNVLQGQNALLTAALLTGGIFLLDRRPVLAGILFGCLFYKPHFAVLTPLLLLLDKNQRALFSQILTVAALSAASYYLMGETPWRAFIANAPHAADLLTNGHVKLAKMSSTFAAARQYGLDAQTAWIVHGIVAALAALLTLSAWKGPSTHSRLAILLLATLLISPFQYDYDLAILLPALLVWSKSTNPFDWTLIILLWLTPYLDLGIFHGINNVQAMAPLMLIALLRLTLTRRAL